MAGKRIMVIDDDANIRAVLQYRLEKEGYSVLLSGDGLDAVERAKLERPDLIILDLALPRLDGFGFLERLRGEAETKAIPVIVLTAYRYEENRTKSLELGAVEFVPKPFSPRKLVADVGRVLGVRRSRVLVVDDDEGVRDLLAKLLEAEGCVVDTADDGPRGVDKALAYDYDLILMDNRMPGCRADEATRRIMAGKPGQRIVIVTGSTVDTSVRQALQKGALACLSKPFNIDDVARMAREWLR